MTNFRLRHLQNVGVALACLAFANGCAVDPKTGSPSIHETFASADPCASNARNIGIAAGAVTGAVLGYALKKDGKSAAIGGAAGALVGGLIGADMDRRRCELSKLAKAYGLDVEFANINADGQPSQKSTDDKGEATGLSVTLRDSQGEQAQFESGSDRLTVRAQTYFTAIAAQYNPEAQAAQITDSAKSAQYKKAMAQRKLLLIGHTDDTGSSSLNAGLSERRASAVAKFLSEHGVPRRSLYFQGAGETLPVADNRTDNGRAKNRRVEIVEIFNESDFDKYLSARTPRYEYYRNTEVHAAPAAKETVAGHGQRDVKPGADKTIAKTDGSAAANDPAKSTGATVQVAAKIPAVKPRATTSSATPANTMPVSKIAARSETAFDFGGSRLNTANALLGVGTIDRQKSGFGFISQAYADDAAVLSSCDRDRPRVSGAVKSLQTGQAYKTTEYLPGLFATTWFDKINGYQLVLNKVAVLRDSAAPVSAPELKIYANYDPLKNRNPKPDLQLNPDVNVYRGSDALLYRVFADGTRGVQCFDILLPRGGGFKADDGRLLYQHQGAVYVAKFQPQMLRSQN